MSDEQEQATMVVAEPTADDWQAAYERWAQSFRNAMEELTPYVQHATRELTRWWQQSGLADVAEALRERERIEQRQRITGAKKRARIVTAAKGGRKRHD